MLIKKAASLTENDTTSESHYLNRRQFIGAGLVTGAAATLGSGGVAAEDGIKPFGQYQKSTAQFANSGFYTRETQTPFDDATHYNNFYEFGTGKTDPARYQSKFVSTPWSITVDGHCQKPGRYHLEDLMKPRNMEERIYRLRCVEAWSMVIPWIGFSLGGLLSQMEPTSKAKYVAFTTLQDPQQMPGQRSSSSFVDWPYIEGLRMDEAMHPLTLMAVGLYGREILPQNGAPIRLVVPWKYGFKSIKSIVRISFVEEMPATTWNKAAPDEYGFYANVNPDVSHPRWSQSSERRLPSSLFSPNRIETTLFNGYAEQVASLYRGMNLAKQY
ncbi:Protein-methionine-sulfoxide reductase catalytic subunit MsrP [Sinobacterium norvegicum]|uniref:Protein-methionine-sulfoxide reductase catalytic subunit MsrP n=1 Tax=Sinobacterium norvegicum TaxID=1641715 RepID=A0ABN8EQA2_9GAMM|nr:protein-methionine-sulfoxide reductase catalytic subunit MsrP [Sinobacterium norvegicum]CAH0993217.1 Protein-methionine-sulfoxide reductase catalytic subunit MsrP [Sinobacterium norvegicum]